MSALFSKLDVMKVSSLVLIIMTTGVFASYAAEQSTDKMISASVKEALKEDPRVVTTDVNVTSRDGIITLSGSVWNLAEKNYADLETKKIKGVRGVINELKVTPSDRSNTDILQDIKRRLINSSVLTTENIGVEVSNGYVLLSGTVNSAEESMHAELLATEVRGVTGVENHLAIEYKTFRTDEEIKKEIIDSLHRDVYLVTLPVTVTVRDGIVSLTGTVGSAYERKRAEESAFVDNVKKIENKLFVSPWVNEEGVRKSPPVVSDKQLEKTIHEALYQHLNTAAPSKINVTAFNGQITLEGTVPTYYQKLYAAKIAKKITGAGWVSNDILVHPVEREDQGILLDAKSELRSDYVFNKMDIGIKVHGAEVTLTGRVNAVGEKERASEIISRIKGVKEIFNNIEVIPLFDYPDNALEAAIHKRLNSNAKTKLISDKISVTVLDGIATLTGAVDNWSERYETEKVVFLTQGVRGINNRLTVTAYDYPWNELFKMTTNKDHS